MNKSIILKLFTLLLMFTLVLNVSAQSVVLSNIERSMSIGDVAGLANYFGNAIDITINQHQSTYSRAQAQMVLRDFFKKNDAHDFNFKHAGNAPTNNILFCVGNLIAGTGTFRIYMYLKQQSSKVMIIREIRINK
jgi:hypothetical protein